jgi:hypothetical protein
MKNVFIDTSEIEVLLLGIAGSFTAPQRGAPLQKTKAQFIFSGD